MCLRGGSIGLYFRGCREEGWPTVNVFVKEECCKHQSNAMRELALAYVFLVKCMVKAFAKTEMDIRSLLEMFFCLLFKVLTLWSTTHLLHSQLDR